MSPSSGPRPRPAGPGGARAVALEAVADLRPRGPFLRDRLDRAFARAGLDPRDRALATQLAAGAVRHRRTLDRLLRHLRGEAWDPHRMQPVLLAALELGAFQLLFLDRVPDHAAVHETVRLVRERARGDPRKVGGFANAMLRGLQRLLAGRDPEAAPGPAAVPHPEGGVVRLREAVLPDPAADRAVFLAVAYSYPDWLVRRWLAAFGPAEAEAVCAAGDRRPRTLARVSPEHGPAEALAARLAAEGHDVAPGPRPGTLDLSGLAPETLERIVARGEATVQDPAAMLAVETLAPRPGEQVLDLCASPGTKTGQLVEAGAGRVVACDRSEAKLEPLRRLAGSPAGAAVEVALADRAAEVAPPGGYDAALVDAPCSNTGVLARRVEARWRLRPGDLAELAQTQLALLRQAAALVRPGGRVAYSTCSLEAEENDGVVQAFLAGREGWRLAVRRQLLPSADHDGAFVAVLAREDAEDVA